MDGLADRFLAGRTRMTWDATGQATLYGYEQGIWDGSVFTPNTNDPNEPKGTDVRTSATTGYIAGAAHNSTPDDFAAISGHSVMTVTITTAQGVVREETHICDATDSFALASARDHDYEPDGWHRHIGVKTGGVFLSKTAYLSDTVTRERDQDGSFTYLCKAGLSS
jgi:hypothetical protein